MPIKKTEFELIEEVKKWVTQQDLTVKIGDDAAAFNLEPNQLSLLTTDSLIENVHFKLNNIKAEDLGFKSLIVNISDIAAMGGTPLFATISLGLPPSANLAFVKDFYKGITEAANKYSVTIAGGDLSRASELIVNVTLIGQVDKDKILRRSNAKVGDKICVTGSLGASKAGLILVLNPKLKVKHRKYLLKKHYRVIARTKQAREAAALGVKTAIDISDGLIGDCLQIAKASLVGCRLFAEKIPIDQKVIDDAEKLQINPLDTALSGGEDYELILIVPDVLYNKISSLFKKKKWPLLPIGEIIAAKKVVVVDGNGHEIEYKNGYEHFKQ